MLAPTAPAPSFDLAQWPPAGAEAVDITDLYASHRPERGGLFRAVEAVWRRDRDLFAEVRLPEGGPDAQAFGLHPALLDAAAHAAFVLDEQRGTGAGLGTWSEVTLHAVGAGALRVRIRRDLDGAVGLDLADDLGAPVATVGGLTPRPFVGDSGALHASSGGQVVQHDALFQLDWVRLPLADGPSAPAGEWAVLGAATGYADLAALGAAVDAGAPVPPYVVVPLERQPTGNGADALHDALHGALALVRSWLDDQRFETSRLVVLTRGAVAGPGEGVEDLPHAAVWGLVRSAETENPGRFVLVDVDVDVDVDADENVDATLSAVLASSEPELLLRDGVVRAPG